MLQTFSLELRYTIHNCQELFKSKKYSHYRILSEESIYQRKSCGKMLFCFPVFHSRKPGNRSSVRLPLVSCTISTWLTFPVFLVEAFKTPQLLVLVQLNRHHGVREGLSCGCCCFGFCPHFTQWVYFLLIAKDWSI